MPQTSASPPECLHEPEIRSHPQPVSTWTLAIAQFKAMGYRGLLLGLAVFMVAFAGIAAIGGEALAVSIVVPIYGAMFLAYSLRADYYGVSEIENVCPLGPGQLMLARIVAAGGPRIWVPDLSQLFWSRQSAENPLAWCSSHGLRRLFCLQA